MTSLMVFVKKGWILDAVLWIVLIFCVLPAQAESGSVANTSLDDIPASPLLYVSDYISFVGQDSQGKVAFAIDNGRGRDGEAYQAQHFLVLHDENTGWVRLDGNSRYENGGKGLKTIPASPALHF